MNLFSGNRILLAALILVTCMSLMRLPLPAAKAKRGSMVVVTMADGSQVKGELLSVRADALLLYESDSSRAWHIYLQQVAQVKVLKKSKFFDGLAIGIGVGFVNGVNNLKNIDRESLAPIIEGIGCFLPLPIIALSGGLVGAVLSMPKKISLAGVSPETLQQNLRCLKRYARER